MTTPESSPNWLPAGQECGYYGFSKAVDSDICNFKDHGFFMHPPLLKATAGRRRNQRFKGCTESNGNTTRRKGQHQCPICKGYGHRWYNCKDGDPDDIAAMLAERGAPKKWRKKAIEPSDENSIVPLESTPSGLVTMYFPPSQECTTSLGSGKSIKSGSGSNQPEPFSIEYPKTASQETTPQPAAASKLREKKKGKDKAAGRNKKKQVSVPPDSPSMGTRSKAPKSPAQGTRSKRKILD